MEIFEYACMGIKAAADLAAGTRDTYGIITDIDRAKRAQEAHVSGLAREAEQKLADEEYRNTQKAAGDLARDVRSRYNKLVKEIDELKEARKKARTDEEKKAIADEINLLMVELAAMSGSLNKGA